MKHGCFQKTKSNLVSCNKYERSGKTKCAGCHGASGEGKPAIKAPALKGTNLKVSQLVEQIAKGESGSKAPHNKGIAGLNDEQAKAIAEFVKTLK